MRRAGGLKGRPLQPPIIQSRVRALAVSFVDSSLLRGTPPEAAVPKRHDDPLQDG